MREVVVRTAAPQYRDLLLAVPDLGEVDVYQLHQQVWRQVRDFTHNPAPEFLFRTEGPLVRVRSRSFQPAGTRPSRTLGSLTSGVVNVDLAAVRQSDRQEPIPEWEIEGWVAQKLESAGMLASEMKIQMQERRGKKCDRTTGRIMHIHLPVASVKASVKVVDQQMAESAWNHGLGRGKRFGLGMLTMQ